MKYKKKPVIIDALHWDGSLAKMLTINEYFPELVTTHLDSNKQQGSVRMWSIATLEGYHVVSKGDYIIKGIKGEFYPCKPDIFELTYDAVDE